jgi:hypothetical protein
MFLKFTRWISFGEKDVEVCVTFTSVHDVTTHLSHFSLALPS